MAYQNQNITDRQRELINLRVADELSGQEPYTISEEAARAAGTDAAGLRRAYDAYTNREHPLAPETTRMLEAYAEIRREQLSTPDQIGELETDYLTRHDRLQRQDKEHPPSAAMTVVSLLSFGVYKRTETGRFDQRIDHERDTYRIDSLIDYHGDEHPNHGGVPNNKHGGGRNPGGNTPGGL